MPKFATPGPITADLDLVYGTVQVNAGDGAETTVRIRPRDPDKEADLRAAEQIEAEFAEGRLTVRDTAAGLSRILRKGVADVTIDLPAGSRLEGAVRDAGLRCTGVLGATRITASSGNIAVDRVAGTADLTTSHGWVRAGEVDGAAAITTSTGAVTLGAVTGRLRVKSAHGAIAADRALDNVEVRTVHGGIRIGEVVRGRADLETSHGEVEVGIAEGTAAWLDAASRHGAVSNSLDTAEGPGADEETVEVRARTDYGDIVIRRA
ncbi:DUF4097 family beta strand repeat-containing protein [Nocardiopsis trehalosi]|jgi:DUF4097 and DUF4098 domain-containing protein YvlB|uniref:DUF4097 family beta strand repeat-containing protein n=1 Tax=Nocardiopsis trehalosi TaxID=109329 RepID=UPI00082E9DED|nr:DUF4097 family beta strand repeat-containing protein [Nocardiopsis trehalosi]